MLKSLFIVFVFLPFSAVACFDGFEYERVHQNAYFFLAAGLILLGIGRFLHTGKSVWSRIIFISLLIVFLYTLVEWFSYSGDCGYRFLHASIIFVVVSGFYSAWEVIQHIGSRRRR